MVFSLFVIFLGTLFVFSGIMKVFYFPFFVDRWEEFGYSKWLLFPIGFIELIGAFALFAGTIAPSLAFLGAFLLSFIMIGAIFAHLVSARQHWQKVLPAIVCLALLILVMLITY
jgi:hypothetical protein